MESKKTSFNQNFEYFIQGFTFLNKHLQIYLISILFAVATLFVSMLSGSSLNFIQPIALLIIIVFSLSYNLSVPIFYRDLQEKKNVPSDYIWEIIQKNLKRILIPLLILFFIAILLVIIIGLLLFSLHIRINGYNAIFIRGLSLGSFIFSFVASLVTSTLIFTAIFFSIEKFGLLSSLKKSLIFSSKNFNFVVVVFFISFLFNIIIASLGIFDKNMYIHAFIRSIISSYLYFGFVASSLFYYQQKQK